MNELLDTLKSYIPVSECYTKPKPKWSFGRPVELKCLGEYQLDRQIGTGRNCSVHLAWRGGIPFAVKVIPCSSVDSAFIERIDRGLAALSAYLHPHIMSVLEAVVSNEHFGLVMEWARGGDMHQFLHLNGRITNEAQTMRWFAQLVSAVDFLQYNSFVHHDIKPENILITKEGDVMLTDFEMGESFRKQGFPLVQTACGSVTFGAPEIMLSSAPYDGCKADIWALGVTLYTMATGMLPFDDYLFFKSTAPEIAEQYQHIQCAELKFPDFVSSRLQSLIRGMLNRDPTSRMSIAEVRAHELVAEFSINFTARKDSAGSLVSDISLQTLNSLHGYYAINTDSAEFRKPVRGPIIWDPEAMGQGLQSRVMGYYDHFYN